MADSSTANGAIRAPPASIEAEQSLIGGVLIGGPDALAATRHVPPAAFFRPSHRLIWRAILGFADSPLLGMVDNVTIRAALSQQGLLDKAGGAGYLVEVVENTPGPSNVAAYARIVLEQAAYRDAITKADRLAEAAYRGDGSDVQAALDAIRTAPPVAGDEPKAAVYSLGDLYDMPERDVPWLVDRLLPLGGLSMLVAPPKAGKSTLARVLAVVTAKGGEWLGRDVMQGPVLHLALEESLTSIKRHYAAISAPRDGIYVTDLRGVRNRAAEAWKLARAVDARLVIVDTLQRMLNVDDGNDYAQVSRELAPFIEASRDLPDCHLLCIHHARKSGGEHGLEVLGSTALSAAVDTVLSLKRDGGEGQRRMIEGFGRDDAALERTMLTMDANGWIRTEGTKREQDDRDLQARIIDLLDNHAEPIDKRTIRAEVAADNNAVTRALRQLGETREVVTTGSGKRGDPFLYAVSDPYRGDTEYRNAKPDHGGE